MNISATVLNGTVQDCEKKLCYNRDLEYHGHRERIVGLCVSTRANLQLERRRITLAFPSNKFPPLFSLTIGSNRSRTTAEEKELCPTMNTSGNV